MLHPRLPQPFNGVPLEGQPVHWMQPASPPPCVVANRRTRRKVKDASDAAKLTALQRATTPASARRILRTKDTGAWLTAMPDALHGTKLSSDEFRDSLVVRLRFGLTPSSLPHRCEGCGQRFTVEHAMSCKKGGLVTLRHDDVAVEWRHLCAQALTPATVTDEPLIHTSRDVRQSGANATEPAPEL